MLIGICGGSGCGKGLCADRFKKAGIPVIDADLIARKVTEKGSQALEEIENAFGEEYISPDGELLRKKLGSLVFKNPDKLAILNGIIKKHIENETLSQINSQNAPIVALDAPLLIEYGMDKLCHKVIAVLSDRDLRIKRIMERDAISKEDAANRILSQKDDEFYIAKADYIVYNNSTKENVYNETDKIILSLREML